MNPMGIAGPGWTPNYIQPNTGKPTVSADVANYSVGSNPMGLTWPIPTYTQPNNPSAAVQTGGTLL